jgi:hypothetical protein
MLNNLNRECDLDHVRVRHNDFDCDHDRYCCHCQIKLVETPDVTPSLQELKNDGMTSTG